MTSTFQRAFAHMIRFEGGYANDPVDLGGETILGISRKFWPLWLGWSIVDDEKSNPDFPDCLYTSRLLKSQVEFFYLVNFWKPIQADEIAIGSPDVAIELFDAGVHMGVGRTGKFFQLALNLLNRDENLYDDLVVDGAIGPASLDAFSKFLQTDDPDMLYKVQVIQRGAYYCQRATTNTSQERFIRGWLNRVNMENK